MSDGLSGVTILVTDHALQRWRQRFALYGDESKWAVVKAAWRSRPATAADCPGQYDSALRRLRIDPQTGAVLVFRGDGNRLKVVTVMVPDEMPPARRGAGA